MTTFNDVFKKSFLNAFAQSGALSASGYAAALAIALILSAYIFFCYRLMTRRVFYSRSFNVSLVALTVITTAIILTIRSSVVVSLGMVGALSIVRFRTAIKEPMDLVFLYWAIGVGIMVGAGQRSLAVLLCVFATVGLVVFDLLPVGRAPMLLLINGRAQEDVDARIRAALKQHVKTYQEKSRSVSGGNLDLVIELRINSSHDYRCRPEAAYRCQREARGLHHRNQEEHQRFRRPRGTEDTVRCEDPRFRHCG